jgi:hypothetical protein
MHLRLLQLPHNWHQVYVGNEVERGNLKLPFHIVTIIHVFGNLG